MFSVGHPVPNNIMMCFLVGMADALYFWFEIA